MKFTCKFAYVALLSFLSVKIHSCVTSSLHSFPPYLTHGHYNQETDTIEACKSTSHEYCEEIDYLGREEIWLFWANEKDRADLFIENTHETYQLDQRIAENNQWRKLSSDLVQKIALESNSSMLSIFMTNVKFSDLRTGMQTVWFKFPPAQSMIVPTIIHCYRTQDHDVKCIWVF